MSKNVLGRGRDVDCRAAMAATYCGSRGRKDGVERKRFEAIARHDHKKNVGRKCPPRENGYQKAVCGVCRIEENLASFWLDRSEHIRSVNWSMGFCMKARITNCVLAYDRMSVAGLVCRVAISMVFIIISQVAQTNAQYPPFESVDGQGYVFVVEKIGCVILPGGASLPINLNFSSRPRPSTVGFGSGWECPLLESRIVQNDEHSFTMQLPEGGKQALWRSSENDLLLAGYGGWSATVSVDTITAYNVSGKKLVFRRGYLSEICFGDSIVSCIRENKQLVILKEANIDLVKFTTRSDGLVSGILLNGSEEVAFDYTKRPIVRDVKGIHQVVGYETTLGGHTGGINGPSTCEFGVDDNLDPTLRMEDGKQICWDAKSNHIKRDNIHSFEIHQEKPDLPAFIERKLSGTELESWSVDYTKGIETILKADGAIRTTNWFVSGPLLGKVRSIVNRRSNNERVMYKAAYDDKSRILREVTCLEDGASGSTTKRYNYNDAAKVTTCYNIDGNGKELSRTSIFEQGGAGWKDVMEKNAHALSEYGGRVGMIQTITTSEDPIGKVSVYEKEGQRLLCEINSHVVTGYKYDKYNRIYQEWMDSHLTAEWTYDSHLGYTINYYDASGTKTGYSSVRRK